MTHRRTFLALALVAAGAAAGAALAEDLDVPKLFDSAKASYAEKHYGKCWGDVQLIVAEVARMRMEALKAALPNAPEGWKAEEAEGSNTSGIAWFATGTQVKRRYTKGDETSANLELWADAGPILASIQMFLSNPGFVPQGSKIVTVKGRRALLEYHKDGKEGNLSILLNVPNSFLKLEARGVTEKELSDGLPGGFDLEAIEKAIAN